MWMGEIDCRNHVCKHAASRAGIRRVAGELGERLVRSGAALAGRRDLAFVTLPPPTIAQHGNRRQPTVGTFAQRQVAVRGFNAALKAAAAGLHLRVLDVCDELADSQGAPNPAYFADGVHADPRCLPMVLQRLCEMGWLATDDPALVAAEALAMVPPAAGVAGLPGGLVDARDARQLLIEHAAMRCKATGARTIAIYGAGQHTRSMRWEPFERLGLRIACVLDDRAASEQVEAIRGVSVVAPRAKQRGGPAFDAIVVSSDAHEGALLARARAVFGARMPIIPIYSWRARDAASVPPSRASGEQSARGRSARARPAIATRATTRGGRAK
jgi:hypothetical protein